MTEQTNEYKHLRRIADDPPPPGKFVAIIFDGGSASLFRFSGDTLYGFDNRVIPLKDGETIADVLRGWYEFWIPLPDDFELCPGEFVEEA